MPGPGGIGKKGRPLHKPHPGHISPAPTPGSVSAARSAPYSAKKEKHDRRRENPPDIKMSSADVEAGSLSGGKPEEGGRGKWPGPELPGSSTLTSPPGGIRRGRQGGDLPIITKIKKAASVDHQSSPASLPSSLAISTESLVMCNGRITGRGGPQKQHRAGDQ